MQVHVTLDIEFIPLAELLGISTAECYRQWDEGELEDTINNNLSVEEVVELCNDQRAYDGVRVGSGYSD